MPSARIVVLLVLLVPSLGYGQDRSGRIEGRVLRATGEPIGGVSVVLNETSATAITSADGRFTFSGIPAGRYSLTITLGENLTTIPDVEVVGGATTPLERTVDWVVGFTETLVVSAPSRQVERIIDAPGAVSSIPAIEVEQRAAHAQLPKLLEFSPGVQVTQSGIYDYNLNTRGFNSSLSRRVATLIDGRDPSIPFLGSQEWAAIPFPLDDLAGVELLRGPSAALYGANASSGVLNLTTKDPRNSLGGAVRLTVGQLGTANLDFRWAHDLGGGWYTKLVGGIRHHDDFTVSRVGRAEYSRPCAAGQAGNCLPQETVPLVRDDDQIFAGAARLDKHLANGMLIIMEGGIADLAGPVFQTGIGRVQFVDVQRPWARADLTADRFNLLASYTGRRSSRQAALASGANLADSSRRFQFEGQTNFRAAQGRVRVVVGGSAAAERIDTLDEATGRHTVLFEPVEADKEAVFGQVDWSITRQLKLVLAGRGDRSTLHDAQFSPKGSVVYTFDANHSLRFTYNEAFQVPNYSELFLQADAAPVANLGALNALCTPFGVSCGFERTRVLALGNADLEVERTKAWEVGYKGILAGRAFLTLDFYRSKASNFVTDLIPQLGTPLGRVNPSFGPWEAPSAVPASVAQTIRSLAPPILSNNLDGSPILAAVSYTNFGNVDTQGIDLGLNYYFPAGWRASLAYSWFDFEIENQLPGFATLLLPNSPEHSMTVGVMYDRPRFNAAVDARWVDDFLWGVGPFQGPVASYVTVDLNANYDVTDRVTVGLQVANAFDDVHWESFGGDLLRRRALTSLRYRW